MKVINFPAATASTLPLPSQPILVVVDTSNTNNPQNGYIKEILTSEGVNSYQTAELAALIADPMPPSYLNSFRLVVLAETFFATSTEQLFRDYVSNGGKLIAMRPDTGLADVFGLTYVNTPPEQLLQFFAMDTTQDPGRGIASSSLQYHGQADRYTLAGALSLANLWSDISTPTSNPAVTLHTFGTGQAAAFTFDLAKSIVMMRQGNSAWQDTEGDNFIGYRPIDMFVRTDGSKWLEPTRTRIPQADEEQRFLANLIKQIIGQPLPRMWYLPAKNKALIINTGDGEDLAGTELEAAINDAASYGGHFTTYLRDAGITGTPVEMEAAWRAAGHETGVHMYGDGSETYSALSAAYANIVASLQNKYGHGSRTARNHMIDWVGWTEMAEIEANNGTRMDTSYYHYAPWILQYGYNANGYFTGSGLAQRFSDENGTLLPIYQILTEWPDEWFDDSGYTAAQTSQIIKDMIMAAKDGYYSAFVTNIHPVRYNDQAGDITHTWSNDIWAYARDNGIPMWTAEKYLDFVEAKNNVSFQNMTWNGTALQFTFAAPTSGQNLTIMIPRETQDGLVLQSLTADGTVAPYTIDVIKGHWYALYTTQANAAAIAATYGIDTTAPTISNLTSHSR